MGEEPDVDKVKDLPYIEQVEVRRTVVPGTLLLTLTVHHIMPDEELNRVARALELILPATVRLAVEL